MYDKAVRRRRAVLALLVALSLILLTAYFGESAGGGLHAVQRGAMEVFAPIQEGANRALKPFRDLFRWFGDTLDAKDRADALETQRDALRRQVAELEVQGRENAELRGLMSINASSGLRAYEPVVARVFARSPSTWYSTVEINKGSSDGVQRDQPVVNGKGLVGKVKSVSDGNAVVMLLTDQDFAASAEAAKSGEPGIVSPAVGATGDLLFNLVRNAREVRRNDLIVTSGVKSSRLDSLFPRAIPIGMVTRVELGEGELDRRIHVKPAADLRRLDLVQVLTRPSADVLASRSRP